MTREMDEDGRIVLCRLGIWCKGRMEAGGLSDTGSSVPQICGELPSDTAFDFGIGGKVPAQG
jgi:hypothetical protein